MEFRGGILREGVRDATPSMVIYRERENKKEMWHGWIWLDKKEKGTGNPHRNKDACLVGGEILSKEHRNYIKKKKNAS